MIDRPNHRTAPAWSPTFLGGLALLAIIVTPERGIATPPPTSPGPGPASVGSSAGPLLQIENGEVVLGNLISIERKESTGNKIGAFLLGSRISATYNSGGLGLVRTTKSGGLDQAFGQGGVVITPLAPKTNRDFLEVSAILHDAQGRMLVVGWRTIYDLLDGSVSVITVARFSASGALDESYGDHGFVQTRRERDNVTTANAALLDREGRLLIAGYSGGIRPHGGIHQIDDWIPRVSLARYSVEGVLDRSFGVNGFVSVPLPRVPVPDVPDDRCQQSEATCRYFRGKLLSIEDRARVRGLDNFVGFTLDPEQRIIAAATASDGTVYTLRFHPNGTLDQRFSGTDDGPVILGKAAMLSTLLWDAQGRLLAIGSAFGRIVELRYTDGHLDPDFGSHGVRMTPLGEGFFVSAAVLDPRGDLFVSAYTMHRLALARLRPDGSLSPDFGVGGVVSQEYSTIPGVPGIALDADGVPLVLALSRDGELSALTLPVGGAVVTPPH